MFAIPCLPNFTIIPRDRSKVVLGSESGFTDKSVGFSKDRDFQFKFWIYGVYVGAAYVAAGLVAACQCPNYLADRFGANGKVMKTLPGVRFDIEKDAKYVTTTFARETRGTTIDTKLEINENNFGFIFSSDLHSSISVYMARCMHKREDDTYINIFQQTTESYIDRVIRILSEGYAADEVKKLDGPGGKISEWKLYNGYVNSILREGDNVAPYSYEDGIGTLDITFAGGSGRIVLKIKTKTN
jgi:hypothetical protein